MPYGNFVHTSLCLGGGGKRDRYIDELSNLTETIDMVPGGVVLNIEKGQWHTVRALESGSVILEMKEGAYEPLQDCDVLKM